MVRKDALAINIVGDIESRRGSYANAALISSRDDEDIIDFIFTDGEDADGNTMGVLASRVIVSRATLLRIRDAIDKHLDKSNGGL